MSLKNIKKECLRIEEDAVYSAKGHYNASDFFKKVHYFIGIPMVFFSAWAGVDVFNNNANYAGYLAFFTATLAALQTFISPDDKAVKHKNSGDEFNSLKNNTRMLREIEINILPEKKRLEKIRSLSNKRDELNKISLQIPKYAFKKAKKGIDEGQAEYLADKE
ncbi:MAG: SLATT domain-containing protein [Gammaproteobacteria bacterium]|nr:SLATT domain-containing protein [Gammaproteobacteria bacterium]